MPRYHFGPFTLDELTQRLLRDGREVPLKPKLFQLLHFCLRNPGRLLARDELMDELWPHQVVADANLTQAIYELRRALGGGDAGPQYLQTVARRGFRFLGELRQTAGDERAGESAAARIASIAVLRFSPLPGQERDEILEFGISDALIGGLSRIPGLRVRQLRSDALYRKLAGDARAIGRTLAVDAVLDGSLQRDAGQLRVSARLLRVADEAVLWADSFDHDRSDIFALEDAICDRVVTAIAGAQPDGRAGHLLDARSVDPAVQELYLKCRYWWHKWTPDAWFRAIECGREAIARDPGHAPSHVWTGASWCCLALAGVVPPREAFPTGEALIDRALELDAGLAVGWECRGAIAHFYHWDFAAAEHSLQRSIALDPARVENRGLYAVLQSMTGRQEQAGATVERARAIDPLALVVNTGVGEVRFYSGELAAAEEAFVQTLELDPFFVTARFHLGQVYAAQGRHAEALAAMSTAVSHTGAPPEESPEIAYALALNGDVEAARAIRDRLLNAVGQRFVDPFGLALIHLGLGEHDAVFHWLDAAHEARSPRLIYLGVNPVFAPLHGDARCVSLLRRIGL